MTDLPYTPEDLRTEAARQHADLTDDPDYVGISERMEGAFIDSTVVDPDPATGTEPVTGTTWDDLTPHEFDTAHRAIDEIINNAVDLSDWAVNLGADGLEPTGDCFSMQGDDKPILRVHFAFAPDMPEDARQAFINGVGQLIANHL